MTSIEQTEEADQKWHSLNEMVQKERLVSAVKLSQENGFDPILIKGWAAGRFYDEGHFRAYTDIDLVVPYREQQDFQEFARSVTGTSIDVHGGLRHLDKTPWNEIFRRSIFVVLNNQQIRVLCDEDHLRIVSTHWLIDGGVNREKLYDVFYMVKNRRIRFDWELCLGDEPARRTWVAACIAAARDRLDLDVRDLPLEISEFQLPRWFGRTLDREWTLGPYRRIYLAKAIKDRSGIIEQLRRRFPPNPIAATVDLDRPIAEGSRAVIGALSLLGKIPKAISGLIRR